MKKKKIIITISIIIVILIIPIIIYINDRYKAINVDRYIISNKDVKVIKDKNTYYFDGPGKDTALIFYQGGKVDNISYAPLLNKLAKQGIDSYLVDMPFDLAFLNIDAAEDILKDNSNKYQNWYMIGHSLGGVSTSYYNNDNIDGYIFLAAYPNKKITKPMLLIRGDKDGVLKMDGYKESKKYWSTDNKEVIITGGNHGNFGNYGKQKGDNKSTISRTKQQDQTISAIINFIDNNK